MPIALLLSLGGCLPGTTSPPPPAPPPSALHTPPSAGIELLSGPVGACTLTDPSQSTVVSFTVRYHHMTPDQFVTATLRGPQGETLATVATPGEHREEEEGGWGLYPQAYSFPQHTPLTLSLSSHQGSSGQDPVISTSTLRYDCSTGQALQKSYHRPS